MSLDDDYIDNSDYEKNLKITEQLNKEAEMRKQENKKIREQYPHYIFYRCNICRKYKSYDEFDPMLDSDGNKKYIPKSDNKIEWLLDNKGNRVYMVHPTKCSECYKKKKN